MNLPDGWQEQRHDSDAAAVFYYHAATGTVTWTRPFVCHGDVQRHAVQAWMTRVAAPRAPRPAERPARAATPLACLHEWAARRRLGVAFTECSTPADSPLAATQPFHCRLTVDGCSAPFVGHGASKKHAKHAAADAALRCLAAEQYDEPSDSDESPPVGRQRDLLLTDSRIVDVRGLQRTPSELLNRYCQLTGSTLDSSVERLPGHHQLYRVTGCLSPSGVRAHGQHPKLAAARQALALALLAQLHPDLANYGQLLDIYADRSLTADQHIHFSPLEALRSAMAALVVREAQQSQSQQSQQSQS